MKKLERIKVEKETWLIFLPENEQPKSAIAHKGVEIESNSMLVFSSKGKWEAETKKLGALFIGELMNS